MDKSARLQHWRRPPQGSSSRAVRQAATVAKKLLDLPIVGKYLREEIINEYLHGEEKLVWDVWQALADTSQTPELTLRSLHQKKRWYLDILLVNLRKCPPDILEEFAVLPKEKTTNLADKNKEIREIARKRLGPLSFETRERLILQTLRLGKREHVALITPEAWFLYKKFPSKRVGSRIIRHLRWRKAFIAYQSQKNSESSLCYEK